MDRIIIDFLTFKMAESQIHVVLKNAEISDISSTRSPRKSQQFWRRIVFLLIDAELPIQGEAICKSRQFGIYNEL